MIRIFDEDTCDTHRLNAVDEHFLDCSADRPGPPVFDGNDNGVFDASDCQTGPAGEVINAQMKAAV